MSTAIAKASALKPEIRLAQAISEFEAELNPQQKAEFRTRRLQSTKASPSSSDVMRLTAEIDRQLSKKYGGQCFGPRFTYFLQGVQQFAALGDIIIGGSQNLIACGVWSLVRMSILSIGNITKYVEKLSLLFMDIGRASPRHEALGLLYPQSKKLQSYVFEYFIVVVGLCRHIHQYCQKSAFGQMASALNDGKLQAFHSDLAQWATNIKEETYLRENQENSGFRAISKKIFEASSRHHKMTAKLRMLEFCSTYNHVASWKQTRKAGRTAFFEQRSDYKTWRASLESCTLVCAGKLGTGKSVLLANVVDDLTLWSENQDCMVTFFFCRDNVPESLLARTVIGSLARQMLCNLPDLVQLSSSFDFAQSNDTQAIFDLLKESLTSDHKTYVVLDGLDECDEAEREVLLEYLLKFQKTFKVLLCTSIRIEPHIDPQTTAGQLANSCVLLMPDQNPDIDNYIAADLERCLQEGRLAIGDPELILEIEDALVKGAQGMFLWATLQIQSLCGMKTDRAIRAALADLPKDLPEIFRRILRRSGSDDRALQEKVLKLILAAQRPLTSEELREALSVTPGDANWDPSRILNNVYSALAYCGPLLVVDEEEHTVAFVHHSVRQYILSESRGDEISFTSTEARRSMADIVVTYLAYRVFGTELSRTHVQAVEAQQMPSRIIHATLGSSSKTAQLAQKLLRSRKQTALDMNRALAEARGVSSARPGTPFKFHVYAKSHWLDHVTDATRQNPAVSKLLTGLLRAQVRGLQRMPTEEETAVLESVLEITESFKTTRTSKEEPLLFWAVQESKTAVIELFAQRSREAQSAHAELLALLIGNVDFDAIDQNWHTALDWAVNHGHGWPSELLLHMGRGIVNWDKKDHEGRTPLFRAAIAGRVNVVELLLDTDKGNADTRDTNQSTPLCLASQWGHKDVVKVLLDCEQVDVDAKDKDGWTPHLLAARHGKTDVFELLLSTDKVDIEAANSNSRAALDLAIEWGHVGIVQLLLGTGKVNLERRDIWGWTPIGLAAHQGYTEIAKLLLDTGKMDLEAKDDSGRTPMGIAIHKGRKNIVHLLLDTGKIDLEARDEAGRTPLGVAAHQGHTDIVELLLDEGTSDIEARDVDEKTPLLMAAWQGHQGVVELLLATDKANVEARDYSGATPLHGAASQGHDATVELLLTTGNANVDAKDGQSKTPLYAAARGGHDRAVSLLLDLGKADPNATDSNGRTPLRQAVNQGHQLVVEVLLKTGKAKVEAKDPYEETLLATAVSKKYTEIVELLLTLGRADANIASGTKPLHIAARNGYGDIAAMLLTLGNATWDARDIAGQTPRDLAEQAGHRDIVDLLDSYEKEHKKKRSVP